MDNGLKFGEDDEKFLLNNGSKFYPNKELRKTHVCITERLFLSGCPRSEEKINKIEAYSKNT